MPSLELGILLSMLMFLWVSAITPGPNNILLTTSAAQFGWRRSLPVMAGILVGMQVLLLLAALGIGAVLKALPTLYLSLKVIVSLYLGWLAWKIATTPYQALDMNATHTVSQPVRWYQGMLLQFLNPKAWLMALGLVGGFGQQEASFLLSIGVMSISLLCINTLSACIWMGFGVAIGKFLNNRHIWSLFNLTMGILTLSCVILIWR